MTCIALELVEIVLVRRFGCDLTVVDARESHSQSSENQRSLRACMWE
jgi:hypothetical protein